MSPQQAAGDTERMDQRSDVFGLGAILCEILTGEPPYRARDGDLVRQATTGALDGAYARLQACGADVSLVTLCVECLARTRNARPESAAQVAARVGAYLTSVEERARQAELRAAEARYRQRATLQAAGAVALVVCVGLAAWYRSREAARERREGAVQGIATAMGVASAARGRAQAAGLDAGMWNAASSTAEQLVALARSDDVSPEARRSAQALLADVRREEDAAQEEARRRARDAAMLERLTTLRALVDERLSVRDFEEREQLRLDAEYSAAFAEYLGGRALLDLASEEAQEGLRGGDIEIAIRIRLPDGSGL
jgi:serine/threonine-protein kinase